MRWKTITAAALACLFIGCAAAPASTDGAQAGPAPEGAAVATFAGGCFWCMEPPFEKLDGVYSVVSGYTGGPEQNPSYKEVSYGLTGHTEAVQITYDPARIDYETLVYVFWRQIDPTDPGGQFADRGTQYHTAIFVHDDEQRAVAEASRAELEASGRFERPIFTPIRAAERFWAAEEYHQDYYKKNPHALLRLPPRLRSRGVPGRDLGQRSSAARASREATQGLEGGVREAR